MRIRKKVPLKLGNRNFATLAEITLVTGRSRSSIYRDLKILGIKVKTLVDGHIPYIRAGDLWRFKDMSWFLKYSDSVKAEPENDSDLVVNLEEQWKMFVPVTRLLKQGFEERELQRLITTGFIPAIRTPGMWLIEKRLYVDIKQGKVHDEESN